jgi:hypothetical protein
VGEERRPARSEETLSPRARAQTRAARLKPIDPSGKAASAAFPVFGIVRSAMRRSSFLEAIIAEGCHPREGEARGIGKSTPTPVCVRSVLTCMRGQCVVCPFEPNMNSNTQRDGLPAIS